MVRNKYRASAIIVMLVAKTFFVVHSCIVKMAKLMTAVIAKVARRSSPVSVLVLTKPNAREIFGLYRWQTFGETSVARLSLAPRADSSFETTEYPVVSCKIKNFRYSTVVFSIPPRWNFFCTR